MRSKRKYERNVFQKKKKNGDQFKDGNRLKTTRRKSAIFSSTMLRLYLNEGQAYRAR